MMGDSGLINLDTEQLKEMTARMPTRKRVAFGKALAAAAQYVKDGGKRYGKAFELASLMIENEWHLGREVGKMQKAGQLATPDGDNQHNTKGGCKENYTLITKETLPGIGVGRMRSSLAQKVAGQFKLSELRKHLAGQYDVKTQKLPRITAVATEAKRREIQHDMEEPPVADGEYDVIILDPPWPMEKVEREAAPMQVEFDYPVMQEIELEDLTIPAADDCHVWCWATHKFLPMCLRLVAKWGFKYVCTFVWHKPGGFQPFNLPQYNCEFAVYARKGTPTFTETKAFPVCFDAKRGKHSEKPQEFYDMVARVTHGRRLDMFNRRKIKGFDGWGNETPEE